MNQNHKTNSLKIVLCSLICLSLSVEAQRHQHFQEEVYIVDTIDKQGDPIVNFSDGSWQYLKNLKHFNIQFKSLAKETGLPTTQQDTSSSSPQAVEPTSSLFNYDWSTTVLYNYNINLAGLTDTIPIKLRVAGHENICLPVVNYVTSRFSVRWGQWHKGTDIGLSIGDPVRSVMDGKVRWAGWAGGYGNLIVVRHYNGLETYYGHLSKINVKANELVQCGQIIGLGGSTGKSTGPHLHFEIRLFHNQINPEEVFDFNQKRLKKEILYVTRHLFYHMPSARKNIKAHR